MELGFMEHDTILYHHTKKLFFFSPIFLDSLI